MAGSVTMLLCRCKLMIGLVICFLAAWHEGNAQNTLAHGDTLIVLHEKKSFIKDSINWFVRINEILITGNHHTREPIILRELRVKKGDVVNQGDLSYLLQREQQKIFNLHLFNTVTITPVPAGDGLIDLQIVVEERWYTFPVLRFHLSDRNFNEWWQNYNHDMSRVNYGMKLYQYNLWGMNHTLYAVAEFGFQKNFRLTYKIPYINKQQKQGLIFDFDYSEGKNVPDSTVAHKLNYVESKNILRTTRGVGITYTFRRNFYLQHRLKYEYRFSTIADTLMELNENYLGNGQTKQHVDGLTYELNADQRDVAAYPLKGYDLLFGIQQNGILFHSDLKKTTAYIRAAKYVPLGHDFFFSDFAVAYWSTPDNIPYFNYTTVGYDKVFVRGYEVYVIEGPYFFLNKATLKKKIFSRNWHLNNSKFRQFNYFPLAVYLKTYADFGYVDNYEAYEHKNINISLSEKMLAGAGFGVDLVTGYDLAIRFEYTFTPSGDGLFFHLKKEF